MTTEERISECPFCKHWVLRSEHDKPTCRRFIKREQKRASVQLDYWKGRETALDYEAAR